MMGGTENEKLLNFLEQLGCLKVENEAHSLKFKRGPLYLSADTDHNHSYALRAQLAGNYDNDRRISFYESRLPIALESKQDCAALPVLIRDLNKIHSEDFPLTPERLSKVDEIMNQRRR